MAPSPLPVSDFPVYGRNHPPAANADYSQGALFLLDKPEGWSSFDVVKFLRSRLKCKKTGHAGTLDPLATGLLVLCTGRATKSIQELQEYRKRYHAFVSFGSSTPSQDAATEPDAHMPAGHVKKADIEKTISERFLGEILQTPPMYSALHKDGKRLYTIARKGMVVAREKRKVHIYENRVLSYENQVAELDIQCSKGTYIRTLAHDLATALGTRGHLSGLRRTETGPFHVNDALQLEPLRDLSRFTDNT